MKEIKEEFLTDEFLSQYRNKQPKWGFGGLGYIVYLRTYSRKKEDGTLERWDETVQRITEGNFRIEASRLRQLRKLTAERKETLILEAERFYHLVFNLVMTPPGRGLWMSGTDYAERVGDAENNCWGVSMRPQSYTTGEEPKASFAPVFTFDQAMKGGGVGINIQREYVNLVPKVTNEVELTFFAHEHENFDSELKELGVINGDYGTDTSLFEKSHYVMDSREGWADALREVIDAHYEGRTEILIDIQDVRPRNAPIKGFGGTASGPAPLVVMLQRVNMILNRRVNDFVTPTEWGDVVQNIGTCVVAGNVRRTALILIGDNDDVEFVESKNYSKPENQEATQWRWASNNSVAIGADTSLEELTEISENIYYNGEPGVVSLDMARNFGRIIDGFQKDIDAEVEVFNPCGEITLPNGSPCNLFELNLPRIQYLIDKGIEAESLYGEAAELATRYAYRITLRQYEWEVTRDVVERHRRLGVGITGITDWILLRFGERGVNAKGEFNAEVTQALDELYAEVRKANKEQAEELCLNESIKVTTVKPSGTVSLLMGSSPGMHWHWAPYMIRRIRMAANAPLVDVLLECGYRMEPAVAGYEDDGTPKYDYNTVVVEFPVKAPTAEHPRFQSAGDVPLAEQAAMQAMLATHWSDNAVSATLSFHKAEEKPVFKEGIQLVDKFGNPVIEVDKRDEKRIIGEIAGVLDKYKGTIKSTSLLPYATDTYAQMPYEEITEERYHSMVAKLKAKPWEMIEGGIEAEDEDSVDSALECVGNSCPVR